MTKGGDALNKAYNYKGKTYAEIDCSHLVHKAFEDAGYKYPYCTTGGLPGSDDFTKVGLGNAQRGDIILFDGHMGFIESCELKEDGEFKGTFFGSQSSTGPASAAFSTTKGLYWGKNQKVRGVYRKN